MGIIGAIGSLWNNQDLHIYGLFDQATQLENVQFPGNTHTYPTKRKSRKIIESNILTVDMVFFPLFPRFYIQRWLFGISEPPTLNFFSPPALCTHLALSFIPGRSTRCVQKRFIATSHEFWAPNLGLATEIPLFPGNLGWWSITVFHLARIMVHWKMGISAILVPIGAGNSNIFGMFTPTFGEMIQFDEHI